MKKSVKKIHSPYLETETLLSALLYMLVLLPLLIIDFSLLKSTPWLGCFLMLFTGWLTWTFVEYFNHRFRMHGTGDPSKVIGYQRHILHHHHPTEIKITGTQRFLLFIGNVLLILLCIIYKNWIFLFTGFYSGFAIYSLMHWFLHRKLSAKIFPEVHEFHIHHHCKHPDKCFGVTVTWWDHMFDTIPHQQREITERIKKFYYKS
jgi:sterol desaturase/sphingolipid hydroxylase (fatty acid hydroxylase superfamily)